MSRMYHASVLLVSVLFTRRSVMGRMCCCKLASVFVALLASLALAGTAHADTIIDFESSEGYSLGGLNGQNGWSGSGATVTSADASHGSRSVSGTGYISRSLNDVYPVTDTEYFSIDVKGTTIYTILNDSSNSHNRMVEFGFDATMPGFYAYSGNGLITEQSAPNTVRWVTLWAKVYDSGGGDVKADLGWCELNQTPFVDGLRISAYDATQYNNLGLGHLTMAGSGGSFDNLVVSNVPEPGALVLLATGLIGLLAYAWRKRK